MIRDMGNYIRRPRAARPASLTPRQVAVAYNFPLTQATGKGFVGGLVELGGGFSLSQVLQYFADNGIPSPSFESIAVGDGSNTPDGPNGADGEVQSDMIVVGSVAPGASYRVYFGGNSDADFQATLRQALHECDGVSLSWGSAEPDWDPSMMDQFESAIKAARIAGVPLFVAAGDSGSDDSTGSTTVDFPASSPSSIGCGGTRLTINPDGSRAAEVVWDDDPTSSATGGGVSAHFPGVDVPDIAGNADPDTGYEVMIDGESTVIGGTSLVAPLMLGLYALLWELNGGKAFDFMKLIETNPTTCFDVTSGNNGAFRAGRGRDETTGFGVPDGGRLLTALKSSPAAHAASIVSTFPAAAVNAWLANGRHTYTNSEKAAADAIVEWGESVGLELG